MRTQEEILNRIKEAQKRDMFGFEWQEYLCALPFDSLRPFLRGDLTDDELTKMSIDHHMETPEETKNKAIDYLEFAWGKCNDKRGISANRSLMHYQAWLWLMGVDGFDDLFDNYKDYGRPQLKRIEKKLKELEG